MTLNKETSNEIFENKMPFSVLLCMRVYKVRNTDSDVYEIEFIGNGFHIFYQGMKVSPEARRLTKYKTKEISVATLQFDVTFCTPIPCAPSYCLNSYFN